MTSSNQEESITETPLWDLSKKDWRQRGQERFQRTSKREGEELEKLFAAYVESAGSSYAEHDLLTWVLKKLKRGAARQYARAAECNDNAARSEQDAIDTARLIADKLRQDVERRANGQNAKLNFPNYRYLFGYICTNIRCFHKRAIDVLEEQRKNVELLVEKEEDGNTYWEQRHEVTQKLAEMAAMEDDTEHFKSVDAGRPSVRPHRAIRNEDWEIVDYLPAKAQKFFDQWQELRFVKADYCEHYCVPSNTFDQMVKRFRERVAELRAIVESFGQGYRIGLVCFRNAVTQVRLSNEADLPQTFADVIVLGPKTLPAKFKTEQLDGWQRTVSDGPLETGFKRDVQTAMKIILKLWREPAPSNVINLQAAAEEGSVVGDIRKRQSMLNADELAELLNLSKKHVYRLAKTGRLPHYRLGGAVRFDPVIVAAWLEEKSIAA